jgi:hypothetical protein
MSGPAREGVANCGWLPSPFKRGRFSDPQVPPRLPPVRCRQARSPRVKGRALSISIRNASGLPRQAVSTNGATRLIRIANATAGSHVLPIADKRQDLTQNSHNCSEQELAKAV